MSRPQSPISSWNPTPVDDDDGVVTNLYRQAERWSRFKDLEAEAAELRRSTANDPIIHRHVFTRGREWRTDSFTIQNAAMRAHILLALEDYHNFDPELEEWTFTSPFKPLVHRWTRLQQLAHDSSQEPEAKKSLEQLLAFLSPILASSVKALAITKDTGTILFNDIWQIFPPGELVKTTFYDVEAICRVARYEKIEPRGRPKEDHSWVIHLEYVDWNGERCGYTGTSVIIKYFSGKQHISSLSVYPLNFDDSSGEIRERIIKRGRLFESLRGYHFRNCNGVEIVMNSSGEERPVSGRVIVDTYAYYHSWKRQRPTLGPLEPEKKPAKGGYGEGNNSEDEDYRRLPERSRPPPPHGFYPASQPVPRRRPISPGPPRNEVEVLRYNDGRRSRSPSPIYRRSSTPVWRGDRTPSPHFRNAYDMPTPGSRYPPAPPVVNGGYFRAQRAEDGPEMAVTSSSAKAMDRHEVLDALTDEQCLLANPWVIGMDLKTKLWARFRVNDLSPVVWNDDAFENLILPGNEKDLAWAFVENKALAKDTFDDFVEDKGRGIIILMFGPPGVGKTYTAEAVAERARVPLYNVSAATLGSRPIDVERELEQSLDLCKLWNAMLLLDEADVFLSARSDSDLIRNELVAIFLTKLEYYQGICFMTTNRTASLDHAIQSRVDLFLEYADLTITARRQVWHNFIKMTGAEKFSVSSEDLDELAKHELNGREIKNLVKTAHLLGLKEPDKKIGMERLSMLSKNRLRALMAIAKKQENEGRISTAEYRNALSNYTL